MESDRFCNVCFTDLAGLLGISPAKLRILVAAGLPRKLDGSFVLALVLRWLLNHHDSELAGAVFRWRFSTEEMCGLLDVCRQTLVAWTRAGLPRNVDGTYSLRRAVPWVRQHCEAEASKKYQSRLLILEKKMARNLKQLQRFVTRSRTENFKRKAKKDGK